MNGGDPRSGTVEQRLDELVLWLCPHGDISGKNNALAPSKPYISPKLQVRDAADSGRGLHALTTINSNETIIKISPQFLMNFTTVVRHITAHNESITLVEPHYVSIPQVKVGGQDKFTEVYSRMELLDLVGLTSFQLISMYLTFEKQRGSDSWWSPFINLLPQLEELALSPLVWKVLEIDTGLYDLLPKVTKKHADDIYNRFTTDYEVANQLISSKNAPAELLPKSLFLWAWMCINSRCLYMDIPQAKTSADNFTLAPYVDFLNHDCEDQCGIKIDNNGFRVYTTSRYLPEEQLYFSYGPHSNEFLLCEYGFMLPKNKWNYLNISEYLLPLLKPKQMEFLKQIDYYDDYTISEGGGISFRTEVAFAVLQEAAPEESTRLKSLVDGHNDGKLYMKNSHLFLEKILQKITKKCDDQKFLEFSANDDFVGRCKRVIGDLYRDMTVISSKTLEDIGSS